MTCFTGTSLSAVSLVSSVLILSHAKFTPIPSPHAQVDPFFNSSRDVTKELTIADREHQLFEGLSHWNSFIRKATQVEFPPVMSSEDPVLSSSLSPRGPCIDNDSACRTWVKPCSQDICLGVENLKWAPYRVHTNFLRAKFDTFSILFFENYFSFFARLILSRARQK